MRHTRNPFSHHARRAVLPPLLAGLAAAGAVRPAAAQAGDYALDALTWSEPLRLTLGAGVWRFRAAGAWNPAGYLDVASCSQEYGTCLSGWTTDFEIQWSYGDPDGWNMDYWERHGRGVTFWNRSLAVRYAADYPAFDLELGGPATVWLRAPQDGRSVVARQFCSYYPVEWCPGLGPYGLGPTPEPPLGDPETDPGEGPPTAFATAALADDPLPIGAVRLRVQRLDAATTVPEPSTGVLAGVALVGLGWAGRRLRRS